MRKQRSLRGRPESLSNSLHSPSGQEAKSPLEETVRHWMPLLITASDPAERKAEGGEGYNKAVPTASLHGETTGFDTSQGVKPFPAEWGESDS